MPQQILGSIQSRKQLNDLQKVFSQQIFPSLSFVHKENQSKKFSMSPLTSPTAALHFERLTSKNFKYIEADLEFTNNEGSINNNILMEEINVKIELLTCYARQINLIEQKVVQIETKIDSYEEVFGAQGRQICEYRKKRQIKERMKMICQ